MIFHASARLLRNFCKLPVGYSLIRTQKQCISNIAAFREIFVDAKHVVVLTGAGISAESGIPTFRGSGGMWRTWHALSLASPEAFAEDPSLVWEYYHYRREVVLTRTPNNGHLAIAECQQRFDKRGRELHVITQNTDHLHQAAGTNDVIELHGSLFKTRCTECGDVQENWDSPICEALRGKGEPLTDTPAANIPLDQLPRCKTNNCGGLLRPHVVWFGEAIDPQVRARTNFLLDSCDFCLIVGSSSVVYPAAMFGRQVAARGIPVIEFNLEETPSTNVVSFHFGGLCGETLPLALAPV